MNAALQNSQGQLVKYNNTYKDRFYYLFTEKRPQYYMVPCTKRVLIDVPITR